MENTDSWVLNCDIKIGTSEKLKEKEKVHFEIVKLEVVHNTDRFTFDIPEDTTMNFTFETDENNFVEGMICKMVWHR